MRLGHDLLTFFRSRLRRGPQLRDSLTDEPTLIPRGEVVHLYNFILGREPESEEIIDEKRQSGSASDVGFGMLISEEFMTRNIKIIRRMIS